LSTITLAFNLPLLTLIYPNPPVKQLCSPF
jgi:hypothetical protein